MRPDPGTSGKKIALISNFFEIRHAPSNDLHLYHVEVIPDVGRSLKLQAVAQLRSQHSDVFGADNRFPAYDGEAVLFCSERAPWDSFSEVVNLPDRRDPITIKLEHVAIVDMSTLKQYVSGAEIDQPQDCIHALDVVLRTTPLASCTSIGSSFFSGRRTLALDAGTEIWLGYHQSVRPAHNRLLVNLDLSSVCLHLSQPVLELVQDITKKSASQIAVDDRQTLRAGLIGLRVLATHQTQRRRKYQVHDVTKFTATQQTFEWNDGTTSDNRLVSVVQYFEERYGITLEHPNLPLLQVGTKERTSFLPMEVCQVAGGQRLVRSQTSAQRIAMIKKTALKPQARQQALMNCISERQYDADPVLRQFGVKIHPSAIQLMGRVLDPPTILYNQQRSKRAVVVPQLGSWKARESAFYSSPPINSWAVVVLERRVRLDELSLFLSTMNEVSKGIGLVFHRPAIIPYDSSRRRTTGYGDILQHAVDHVQSSSESQCQLLLIILPFDDPMAYSEIKLICDTVIDVPSQCMLSKHIARADRAYCSNLLLKINTRVGGVNNVLRASPSHDFLFSKPAIVIGADVSHAAPFSSAPSVAAVVASMDAFPYRYACTVQAQNPRQELVEHLKMMSVELLKKFYVNTRGKKPERIIFYRDGVSEGQFQQTLHFELSALRQACTELEEGYTPKITFIVVQKRHHARFFVAPDSAAAADRSGNVPAGTVVDSEIVHPTQMDFYLVAHEGLQGTSRPSHYTVLFDENQFSPDFLQDFTYRQSYLYARCTRSVSLIPAVYYAHLAALRARYHMKASKAEVSSGWSSEEVPEPTIVPQVKDRTGAQMYFV